MSRIMAHLVAHYPDRERSLAVARGLINGGASYLEVQFPFSDPTADGPAIQAACQAALDVGFSVDEGFSFVRAVADEVAGVGRAAGAVRSRTASAAGSALRGAGSGVPIFIMTYASLLFARGVERFMQDGLAAGATGFILPDIPVDYDEGTWDIATRLGAKIMPVTVTSARPERLALIAERNPEYVYVALRRGITGRRTEIGEENVRVLDQLRATGAKVMAGFGISERSQVEALDPHVHAAVVGSAFVRAVAEHAADEPGGIERALADAVAGLAG